MRGDVGVGIDVDICVGCLAHVAQCEVVVWDTSRAQRAGQC